MAFSPSFFLNARICVFTNLASYGIYMGLPSGASGKEPSCQCKRHERHRLDSGLGRSPGGGNDNPLQYSCLENPMGGGARPATVHGGCKGSNMTEHKHRQYSKYII